MLLILVVIRHLRAKYSSFFFISFFSLTQNPSSPLLCFLLFISVHWSPLSITAFFFFFFQLSSSTSSLLFYPLRSLPIIIGHQQHLHYLLLSTIVFISSVRAPHHHQFHLLLDVAIAMSGATQLVRSSPVSLPLFSAINRVISINTFSSPPFLPLWLAVGDMIALCITGLPLTASESTVDHWEPSSSSRAIFLPRLSLLRLCCAWLTVDCLPPFTGDLRWVLNPQSLISAVLELASVLVEL